MLKTELCPWRELKLRCDGSSINLPDDAIDDVNANVDVHIVFRHHDSYALPQDYGTAQYYRDVFDPQQSSYNYLSNLTSDRFLCNVKLWTQGRCDNTYH